MKDILEEQAALIAELLEEKKRFVYEKESLVQQLDKLVAILDMYKKRYGPITNEEYNTNLRIMYGAEIAPTENSKSD